MDLGSCRDIFQGKGVARFDICVGTGNHLIAYLESIRSEDISFFSIGVMEQGDPGRTIGVVFNGENFGGNFLLVPLKVDDPIPVYAPLDARPLPLP
jgi:hypothetical protein